MAITSIPPDLTASAVQRSHPAMDTNEIPAADPSAGFNARADRAIDELEAAMRSHPLTPTQLTRLRMLLGVS